MACYVNEVETKMTILHNNDRWMKTNDIRIWFDQILIQTVWIWLAEGDD